MVDGNANYNTDLLSSTFANFMRDKPSDVIFGELVLFDMLRKKTKMKKKGGLKLLEPITYKKSTAVGSYSGYDTLDVSPQSGLTNAEFDWKQYYGTIAFSEQELLINKGDSQVLDLMKARFEQAKTSLADAMDADMFLDGTANGSRAIVGLVQMVLASGTYGNIVRSGNTWWNSQVTAVGGPLAIAGSSGLRRLYNDTSLGKSRMNPDFAITTQAVFEAYEALMDAQMRFTTSSTESAVFKNQNLMFRDVPIFWDDYCQSGVLYMLNSKVMNLVTHSDRSEGSVSQDEDRDTGDFRVTPFQKPVNQDSRVASFFWMGALDASNCRFLGKFTGLSNT